MKHARLFINDTEVGLVALRHSADSWGMGDFVPNDAFGQFAPLFGAWSLIMHEDDGGGRIDAAIMDELHRAEAALDKLRVKLLRTERDEWIDVDQVVIDGPMIEWKVMTRRGRAVNAAGTSRRSPARRPRAAG
jgi:hypothetical protein